jgi:fluoride ion exporter CrcB/FEX
MRPPHGFRGISHFENQCGGRLYSTFTYETLRLAEDRAHLFAVLNAGASIIAGLGAAYFGMALAQAIG